MPYLAPPIVPDAPDGWRAFWALWEAEQFWECHEALEPLWRAEQGPRKWFLNGLINAAVAVYQARRGNAEGAARQLVRARLKLQPFEPVCEGVHIEALLRGVELEVIPSITHLTERQRAKLVELETQLGAKIAASVKD